MKRWLGTPLVEYAPAFVLLIVTIAYLATAYTYRADARAFPVAVAWVMLGFVGLDIASRTKTPIGEKLIRWLNPAAAPDKVESQAHYPARKQAEAIAWVAFFVALMVLVGIVLAVPIYVFASMYIRGRRPPWLCLTIALSITLFIWLLFAQLLELQLYEGILFGAP